ncbi:DUF2306 domain-containing protein [Paenibacillus doosanensis]|uniref:DUF2306 domain-containing protein n=1 Tax=Paenibacillus doosanensis TaxID=1229154 RepID=UPI00217F8D8A|nr:DUF2306 domain-containing protein [Paenibacillus doosanensis]MCS7460986.1 DUF2306 domain-containing protein [Paenibacillus doosanensis]
MSRKRLYQAVAALAVVSIVWALLNRYVSDPGAAEFLARKSGLRRAVHVPAWLTMLDVHILFASVALLAGAVNFSNRLLRQYRSVHRLNGYVYLLSVLAVLLTSGYLAPYATGGKAVSVMFNLWNIVWFAATLTAFVYIKRKKIAEHRRWMMRSYAFCFTNLAIHLFMLLFADGLGLEYETAYSYSVMAAMPSLLLTAEAAIRAGGAGGHA